MSAEKAKAYRHEAAIVAYLHERGARHAERRQAGATKDRGDIAGVPGVVIEARDRGRVEPRWLDEVAEEVEADNADLGVVWSKRRGKGSAAEGLVTMDGRTFVSLLIAAGYIRWTE